MCEVEQISRRAFHFPRVANISNISSPLKHFFSKMFDKLRDLFYIDGTNRPRQARPPPRQAALPRRHPARLPSPSHHLPLPGLLQVRQRSRTSAVGTQRQLSWRQEPSDQFASRPVAS